MKRYDSAGRPGCPDPDSIVMALLLTLLALLRHGRECWEEAGREQR